MSATNDGGSAFPGGLYDPETGHQQMPEFHGMSLRDWFAGKALAGLLSSPNLKVEGYGNSDVAKACYGLADAMLAERAKEVTR